MRELEARARGADAPEQPSAVGAAVVGADHPDRQAAIEQIADALGAALKADVKVKGAARGFTAQISFSLGR